MAEPAIELTSPSVQGSASSELGAPPGAIVFDERAHAVSLDGRHVVLTQRTTFIIEGNKVKRVFADVKPEGHAAEVLDAL